jgi:hypothetical protein
VQEVEVTTECTPLEPPLEVTTVVPMKASKTVIDVIALLSYCVHVFHVHVIMTYCA